MKTTTSLRSLLALSAATALLLSGCGDGEDAAGGTAPDGGQRPGVQQIDDTEESGSPSLSSGGADATGDNDDTEGTDGTGGEEPDASPADVDLADFPLDAGWPDEAMEPQYGGPAIPVDELSYPFADATCGTPAPTPDTTDALRAEFTDVEAYLSRELLVFADADAAVAYVSELDDFYATDACTARDVPGGEATYPLFRVDTGVGGQSFVIGHGTEYEGEPQVGMSALQVVRVGRSVLLDHVAGEGSLASDQDTRELAASMTDTSGDVVAAQCAFTQAGC